MYVINEKVKTHYRRSSDDQPPSGTITIHPLTTEQYKNQKIWNTVAQVGVYGVAAMIGALIGLAVAKNPLVGAIGAAAGVIWGAYEANCIAAMQDEFDAAFEKSSSVTIGRKGWTFNVDGITNDGLCTQSVGPFSVLYVAATTFIFTKGKIP